MSIPGSANLLMVGGAADTTYQIEQSLRFRDNMYLSRTLSSSGDRQKFTLSAWVKDGLRTGQADHSSIFTAFSGTSGEVMTRDYGRQLYFSLGGPSEIGNLKPVNKLRDHSAWYHLVFRLDSTQSDANNRLRAYINGVQSDTTRTVTLGQNGNSNYFNRAYEHRLGMFYSSVWGWDGYMAEVHFLDGISAEPTEFGEYNDDNVWVPKAYSGSYNTNGFYMKFDPSATNGIGHDHSGQGNHFTGTNFATSSSSQDYDIMTDTPTNNHAVFNPNVPQNGRQFFNAALQAGNVTNAQGQSTIVVNEGKWYAEFQWGSIGSQVVMAGVSNKVDKDAFEGATQTWQIHYSNTGKIETAGSQVTGLATWSAGDVIGVAFDCSNGNAKFYKNGTYIGQGTDSNFANVDVVIGGGYGGGSGTNRFNINTGQRGSGTAWNDPPSGYEWLMTSKMPDVALADPSTVFNMAKWTGTGSAIGVTGLGFSPDLVWVKARSRTSDHRLQDSVRGSFRYLSPNLTGSENTNSSNDWFRSFDSDGFTVAQYTTGGTSTSEWAGNGDTYVAWCWKEESGYFDVVTYSGSSSAQSISHNLGAVPAFMIVKCRDATSSWQIYHQSLGNQAAMFFDQTGTGVRNDNTRWNGTTPTSSVFTVGTDGGMNQSGRTYVAYLFAEVPGFSKFSTYKGTGNADGPHVYLGFRPAFLMVKSTTNSNGWYITDSERQPYNQMQEYLAVHSTAGAGTGNGSRMDFLANGFKPRDSAGEFNDNGQTYAYFAFAEHPFGGGNISPTPAR